MRDDDEAVILTERRGHVLLITLNRPAQRNAFNGALAQGLAEALDELDAAPELRIAVLTGAGKGFSAGMDLKAFVAGESAWAGDRGFAGIVRRPPSTPIIAAIEGFAVAGGLEVALACDLIVAGRSAKLGLPEVKRSLVARGGAMLRLPQRVGIGNAMLLALTGEPIEAAQAHTIGLVDRCTADGEALDEALRLAAGIADNGPLALSATKQLLQQQREWSQAEFWERQSPIADPVMASEDAREGATAFAEKRHPQWTGR